jgi:hypothetical protein
VHKLYLVNLPEANRIYRDRDGNEIHCTIQKAKPFNDIYPGAIKQTMTLQTSPKWYRMWEYRFSGSEHIRLQHYMITPKLLDGMQL